MECNGRIYIEIVIEILMKWIKRKLCYIILLYAYRLTWTFCLMKFFGQRYHLPQKNFLEILYKMMMNELRPSLTSGGVLRNKTRVLLFRWPCKKGNHTHCLIHHTCHFMCFDSHNYIFSNESLFIFSFQQFIRNRKSFSRQLYSQICLNQLLYKVALTSGNEKNHYKCFHL